MAATVASARCRKVGVVWGPQTNRASCSCSLVLSLQALTCFALIHPLNFLKKFGGIVQTHIMFVPTATRETFVTEWRMSVFALMIDITASWSNIRTQIFVILFDILKEIPQSRQKQSDFPHHCGGGGGGGSAGCCPFCGCPPAPCPLFSPTLTMIPPSMLLVLACATHPSGCWGEKCHKGRC